MTEQFDLPEGFSLSKPEGITEPVQVEQPEQKPSAMEFDMPEGFSLEKPKDAPVEDIQVDPTIQPTDNISEEPDIVPIKEPEYTGGGMIGISDLDKYKDPEQAKVFEEKAKASNVIADYENVKSKYSTILKQVEGVWDASKSEEAKSETKLLKQGLVDELSNQGFENPRYSEGKLYIDIEGKPTEVDSNIIDVIKSSSVETLAAAGLGALGTAFGPLGAAAGASVGAAAGRGIDILLNKVSLIEDIDNKLIYDQMMEAGIMDAVSGVVGTALAKPILKGAKYVKSAFNSVTNGNIDGAYNYLLTHFDISDTQAKEIVNKFESLVGGVPGDDKHKAIQVLATTRKGGEALVDTSTVFDPKASATVANQVFKRADDLAKSTKNISADNVQTIIKQNLDNYTKEVKTYYGAVRDAGGELTEGFTFDYNKIGLEPLLNEIGKKIEDPMVKQRYATILTRIDDATETRTFNDLIDLRQAVNDIKFSTKNIKRTNLDALNKTIASIDKEINNAADTYIPKSKVWKTNFERAKKEYSKMKSLEKNVLYKALTRDGIDEDKTVKALSKYITAGDNTFYEVMEKLPKKVRNRVDGSVLNEMVEKYSAGMVGGNRAVNFPLLSREISKVKWTAPKAKQITRTVNRMAEVFQNDVNLARVSGKLELPVFQSYLTTDPVVRMKYEMASSIFNYIKQLAPTEKADALALVKHTGDLLDNPLNAKSIEDLKRAMPKDTREFKDVLNFDETLKQLRQLKMTNPELIPEKAK